MRKRAHGEGSIDTRGENVHRLRYRVHGRRYSVTFRGTKSDAWKELRRLIRSGDTGEHIAPDKTTLAQWVEHWLSIGAPGRRKRQVGRRSLQRYEQALRCHVVPVLGSRPIQQIRPSDIDALYAGLKGIAPQTAHQVHTILNGCLAAAERKGVVAFNPVTRAEKLPSRGENDHGMVLDRDELRNLVEGFRNNTLFAIVAVAAFTGARRNEIVALRWSDLDVTTKTLRIERSVERITGNPLAVKAPKTERGKRTIAIDDELVALLVAEREKHLRLYAGVPANAPVDLSLVKLPDDVLMFPGTPTPGRFTLQALRSPDSVTKQFARQAKALGFEGLRFHDLRGTHETLLLDAGVPVHVVAARCGHDPAVLLRSYAKRTRKADISAAAVISTLSAGILRG